MLAGLTVGVLVIPQSMAYAMIAGLPLIYGLYAAVIPQLVYAVLGTSRHLSLAPSAMVSLLIIAGLSQFATPGTADYIALAILLTLITGVLQLLLGLVRLGFVVNFLSRPVISGYTYAAAIIIAASQLKHLLGISLETDTDLLALFRGVFRQFELVNMAALGVGAVAIAVLLVVRKINRQLPGPLLVVVAGIALTYFLGWEKQMDIVGAIPGGLPAFALPQVGWQQVNMLLPTALVIALYGFTESISIGKALQTKHRYYQVRPNQELIALGVANTLSAFFSAFVSSGGFGRSAVNEQAGARTNLASVVSAALVVLTLLFFTPLFYFLPKAILAAIIITAVLGLLDTREVTYLARTNRKDMYMLLITFFGTLLFGVQLGIATGVLLSLGLVIQKSAYPHVARLGKLPDSDYYRNLERFPEAIDRHDVLVFRFDAQLYFANISYFKDKLEDMMRSKGDQLKVVVLNAQSVNALDSSAVRGLEEIIDWCKSKNIHFYMTEIIGPVRDVLIRTGLLRKMGADHVHMRVQDAIDHYDQKHVPGQRYATQAYRRRE